MDVLQGALAFAVAMILFSTVVSGVSEWGLRAINRRPRTVARMIGVFVDREISRRLRKEIVTRNRTAFGVDAQTPHGDETKWKEFTENLVDLLTKNPVATGWLSRRASSAETDPQTAQMQPDPGAAGTQDDGAPTVQTPALPVADKRKAAPRGKGVDRLTTYGFLQRLAKTEVGQAIIEGVRPSEARARNQDGAAAVADPSGDPHAVAEPQALTSEDHEAQRAMLQDLARTYERYTASANEAYRKRGRTVAMIYAIIIALVFNISAWRLFSHLMDSPEAREDLLARVEQTVSASETADARLTALVRALEEPDAQRRLDELKALDPTFDEAEISDLVGRLKSELDPLLSATTLPIGPSYFPYSCVAFGPPDSDRGERGWLRADPAAAPDCAVFAPDGKGPASWAPSLGLWVANVFLAGILIGLGGPFWYRVFSSLSHLTQLLRMLNGGGHSEVMKTDAADQPATKYAFKEATAKAEGGAVEGDIVTVFYTAAGLTPPKVVDGQVMAAGDAKADS